jgi:hypothetical protein
MLTSQNTKKICAWDTHPASGITDKTTPPIPLVTPRVSAYHPMSHNDSFVSTLTRQLDIITMSYATAKRGLFHAHEGTTNLTITRRGKAER